MRRTLLTLCLALAWESAAQALTPPPSAPIGGVYPGATVSAREKQPECGQRYRFTVSAPLGQVERFYVAQSEAAGPRFFGSPPKAGADWRTIAFAEKGPPPGRLLFVMLDAEGPRVSGSVLFTLSRSRSCA